MSPGRSVRLRRTALVTFALGVALVAAEGVVRVAFPSARDAVIPGRFFTVDDDLGWRNRSRRTTVHRTRFFEIEYATDALGFRDGGDTETKAGQYRILLYGDSLIFGWGVRAGERFADLLQRDGVRIFNRGVVGYGLDQEVIAYEKETVRADEALLFVARSTVGRIHFQYGYGRFKPMFIRDAGGGLELAPVPRAKNAAMSVVNNALSPFSLPSFLNARLAAMRGPAGRPAGAGPASTEDIEASTLVDEFVEAILDRAAGDARRRSERLSVLVADLSRGDRARLRQFCAGRNIGFLEIPPAIAASTAGERSGMIFGRDDRHWTARANAQIAGELAPYIEARRNR